ncbi:DUF4381 domain-containing protein [Caldichromatium japonicum]|uniref:DUF4381 domain-containing protein n=1 Tax=Caldichromatium japonicum TaxID=2699430 RepID=A0A6G7VC44_9GAMM|nr:DUF4381 domain-containing protein [Caldichromatium japonicum]QIK37522.1 DUF4381 domain-containing protein [Caldichromatium japonicum]
MDPLLPLEPTLQALRDIRDLPPLPWWPPALGWWLLAAGLIALGLLIWRWRSILSLSLPLPGITLGTWRWEAAQVLRDLRRRLARGDDPKALAGELSELMRCIAMARFGRPACAGLTGRDWLSWLAEHDPNGFSWEERGQILIQAPYAPPGRVETEQAVAALQALIAAAWGWVETGTQGKSIAVRNAGRSAAILRASSAAEMAAFAGVRDKADV